MGKLTISMAIFNSKLLVYQRVEWLVYNGYNDWLSVPVVENQKHLPLTIRISSDFGNASFPLRETSRPMCESKHPPRQVWRESAMQALGV